MRYFVTGGTGFIGRFLVPRLLDRGATVYLLVRASSIDKVDRLREHWGADATQVVAVTGDLSRKRLGVGKKKQAALQGNIDHFFHLAAIYDIAASVEDQLRANVDGTRHALGLARALDAGCFHHVSSIAAAGQYPGTFTETMFEEAQGLDNPYFRTKHEAEALVRAEHKLPWRIYRPGIVVGDSTTGEIDKIDGPYYFFEAVKKFSGVVPDWLPVPVIEAGHINLVPVDFVVQAMDFLAHLDGHDGECFFLTHPTGMRVGALLRELSSQADGPALLLADRALPAALPLSAMHGVLNSALGQRVGEWLLDPLDIPPQALEFVAYPTIFDSSYTQSLLAQGDIYCPDFEDYADVIWRYWAQHLARGESQGAAHAGFGRFVGKLGRPSLQAVVQGRVVVVTGATSGIGYDVALKLARAGAVVILAARTPEKLQTTLDEIHHLGGTAYAYPCDIADMSACDHFVATVLENHGPVDILVNNAGRSIRRSVKYSFDRFHDFERTMQLNYFGALRLIMGFAPTMLARKKGHIINISSIGVLTSPPRFAAYVASKAALDAFSWCTAAEFADQNVRFTTINMPLVKTPMIAPTKLYEAFPTLTPDEAAELVMKAIVDQPKRVATLLGLSGAVAEAVAPNTSEFWLNQAYKLFPDSATARGLSKEAAAAEAANLPTKPLEIAQHLFAQALRGVHW
jgi:NAD(P)-dependent dehydrogenase (short-subunit alcohol dehydrogenase family)